MTGLAPLMAEEIDIRPRQVQSPLLKVELVLYWRRIVLSCSFRNPNKEQLGNAQIHYRGKLTGMLSILACNSPNALICGASALRFASQRFLRALAACKQRLGSSNAGTM